MQYPKICLKYTTVQKVGVIKIFFFYVFENQKNTKNNYNLK